MNSRVIICRPNMATCEQVAARQQIAVYQQVLLVGKPINRPYP
ncbi:hypothetical protein [African swine fever virus]